MSGASRFQVLALPTAPAVEWVGIDGQRWTANLTPQWYRVITALVARTGGTQGRLTPMSAGEAVFSIFESAPAEQTVLPFFEDRQMPVESTLAFPQDVGETGILGAHFPQEYLQEMAGLQLADVPVPEGLGWLVPREPSSPPLPEGVTVGASPYTFTSLGSGYALLSGGTVSSVTWSRDGSTYYATGQIAGFFPMEITDSLVITYTVLPTLTFIRSTM